MFKIYGYARVSTEEQNTARQYSALLQAGVPIENIFQDKISGKIFEREAYLRLLTLLQPDDLIVIMSIDRLGRDYKIIQDEWRKITQELKAHIRVLDMPILDTTVSKDDLLGTFICDLVLQILSNLSEHTWANIKITQRQGIERAKAEGKHLGRPKTDCPVFFAQICSEWQHGEITAKEAIKKSGLKKTTFYKLAKEFLN